MGEKPLTEGVTKGGVKIVTSSNGQSKPSTTSLSKPPAAPPAPKTNKG